MLKKSMRKRAHEGASDTLPLITGINGKLVNQRPRTIPNATHHSNDAIAQLRNEEESSGELADTAQRCWSIDGGHSYLTISFQNANHRL
jgi:hypothetical protein